MAWTEFLPLAAVHFLAVVSPGPDLAVTMKSTLAGGRGAGMRTGLGISAGNLIHVGYTLVGIGLLVQAHLTVLRVVSLLGAAYLAYLGWGMLRASWAMLRSSRREFAPRSHTAVPGREPAGQNAFWIGFLTNALNPKTTLFFVAIFNSLVNPATPWLHKLGYGAWMCSVSAAWFSLVACLLANEDLRNRYLRARHGIDAVLGGFLLLLAVRIATKVMG